MPVSATNPITELHGLAHLVTPVFRLHTLDLFVPHQARNFLAPDELFNGEVEETIDKVRKAVKVLHAFTDLYEEHRQKLKTYFKDGETVREWEFAPELVFARYNLFVERVVTVEVRCY